MLGLVLAATSGCGGDASPERAGGATSTATTQRPEPCRPGRHELTLENGQAARMLVTPEGKGERALIVVLHGARNSPGQGLAAFRGGWDIPGLVLIAPASKGDTWSVVHSEADADLESVSLALVEAYERCPIDRRRVAVGGFSDGGTYALTLGVSMRDLFPAIMALSPGGILADAREGSPRFFVAHGTLDSVLPTRGPATPSCVRSAGPATRSPMSGSKGATRRLSPHPSRRSAGSSTAPTSVAGSARRARSRRPRRH